jgi:hypothetical protein
VSPLIKMCPRPRYIDVSAKVFAALAVSRDAICLCCHCAAETPGGGARLDKSAAIGSRRQEGHQADWVGGASRGRPRARGSLDARARFCDAAMRQSVRVWSRWRPSRGARRRPRPSCASLISPSRRLRARPIAPSLALTRRRARPARPHVRASRPRRSTGSPRGGVDVWVAPRRGRVPDRPRHCSKPLAELGASPMLGALKAWLPGE